jgi:drug/metabolite transporter (DMT)-like permease
MYQRKSHWKWDKYSIWFIGATMIFGCATVIDNLIISHHFFTSPLFLEIWNFSLAGGCMIILYPKVIRKFPTILGQRKPLLTILSTSASSITSFFLIYSAYKRGIVASQANLVLSSQTIFIVLFGMLVLKEKGSLKEKLLSALIAGVGVYLLS